MKPSRKSSRKKMSVNAELNLLPLMNIVIVLIPMLLLSAVFIEIRAIHMAPPPVAAAANEPVAEPLDLSIVIGPTAYVISGRDLPPAIVPRPQGAAQASAPGDEASKDLARALATVVAAHPDNKDVRIVAGPNTRYEELVALMDLARAAGLPSASLASGVEG